tara:strand:- start:664 stop:1242 length:579 start_codon:yes stop_codon:yes gene_type:complete
MPAINENFLKLLKTNYKNYPVFVETGTYLGETIFEMEKNFKELHTIEIKKELYDRTKSKYKGNKIHFYLGDSSTMLKNVVSDLNKKTIFFLDGHWSKGITGRGEKDCPLLEELNIINEYFNKEAIIIIDDYRDFGRKWTTAEGRRLAPEKPTCDWSSITKNNVLSILKNRIIEHYHLPSGIHPEDRFIIKIK